MNRELTALDKKILQLARERRIEEFCQALLEHPESGQLLRVLAQEEDAPEHKLWLDWMEARKQGDQRSFSQWMRDHGNE